ncbi:hypothetical protein [Bradyrhizobium sp. AUGA SZCCT0042]|uniref:hypothetical protein n=1 Tax=Bradyrhizobium sp. AUGA SZCCT0042 TaxID=2807651 RepID=UPI002012098B|nr:hypothetical protein [Bradyrhizobium sp. AUGA SZCCT0042]
MAQLTVRSFIMSDAVDYLHAYAVRAICKARRMPIGKSKRLQRAVGRIYLLLTKEAAVSPNDDHLDDFRTARQVEKSIATLPETGSAMPAIQKWPPT